MAQSKSKAYNPKDDAREFMAAAIQALKEEATKGKGIARLQAIAQLIKLAEPEAMNPGEDDSEVQENTAPPKDDAPLESV